MTRKILIVEDDPSASGLLKEALLQQGYKASVAESAEEALQRLRGSLPDLMILDVALPGMSGFQLCESLKRNPQSATLPIIMLTTKSREAEKVEGLKLGADDYVTKPYSIKELLARINALMRRLERGGLPRNVLESGDIRIDFDKREVQVRKKAVDLRPKEFDLLALFVRRQGQVLSRDFLRESVWGEETIVESHTIEVAVSRLREKLGPIGRKIEAVTGIGYRFGE